MLFKFNREMAEGTGAPLPKEELVARGKAAIASLPKKQRQVIERHFGIGGLSAKSLLKSNKRAASVELDEVLRSLAKPRMRIVQGGQRSGFVRKHKNRTCPN